MKLAAFISIALAISGLAPALAAGEQCRFIEARPEREACYQRQETARAARQKASEEHLQDRDVGGYGINDHRDRWRNEDAECAGARKRADAETHAADLAALVAQLQAQIRQSGGSA